MGSVARINDKVRRLFPDGIVLTKKTIDLAPEDQNHLVVDQDNQLRFGQGATYGVVPLIQAPPDGTIPLYDYNSRKWTGVLADTIIQQVSITAGEAIAKNDLCYVAANGQAYKVVGTNEVHVRSMVGIATGAVAALQAVKIRWSGVHKEFSDLTPGSIYYASPTVVGGITPTEVAGAVGIVGLALSATDLLIDIDTNPASTKSGGVVGTFTAADWTLVDGISTLLITHNLGAKDLLCNVYEVNGEGIQSSTNVSMIPLTPNTSQFVVAGDANFAGRYILASAVVGAQGVQGPPGEGFPLGGLIGQTLVKQSSTDYDMIWRDTVQSVNGMTGVVEISPFDISSVALDAVGASNGVASLDETGHVPLDQLDSSLTELIISDGTF